MLLGISRIRKLVQHSLLKKIACYMQKEEVIKGFPLQTQLRYIRTNNTYDTNSNIFTFQMIYVVQLLSPEFIGSTFILNNPVMKVVHSPQYKDNRKYDLIWCFFIFIIYTNTFAYTYSCFK